MAELIDRHALLKKVYEHPQERERMTDGEWCRKCIYEAPKVKNEMPTINAACCYMGHWIPGKRGKWICSCCGNEIYCTSPDDLQRNHEFCGHCGAEMKEQCDMRTLIEEAIL